MYYLQLESKNEMSGLVGNFVASRVVHVLLIDW